ncbi:ribonucleotide-diphosphate reductase alphasubunit [Vibrio phage VCPH]|nr:ribonucleotide-diphosphate reductase alphasubunit [Vibrio phage VCPH]
MMSEIALGTLRQLYDGVSTQQLIETMIQFCLLKEDLAYTRAAARLEEMIILKNAERVGVDGVDHFGETMAQLVELGLWCGYTLPEYNPEWEDWLQELNAFPLEYWTVKQWSDKYCTKFEGLCVEPVAVGAIGIGLSHFGDTENAFKLAKAIVQGKINLPTPALNGGRTGDFDSVSCCVISGGDNTQSIGVADHIAYEMTAKKAGIGIELTTRSIGAPVKGGRVTHLGKHSLYKRIDSAVKALTQQTRGGSATVTYRCIDPEIEKLLQWKTQKVDIEERIDKLDYSFSVNDAFMEAVITKKPWKLFDVHAAPLAHQLYSDSMNLAEWEAATAHLTPTKTVNAFELLKQYVTARQETGRLYWFNAVRANTHTPFKEEIRLSNLCQEIFLPTKPYLNMLDLYVGDENGDSVGETAFCSLSAINYGNVEFDEMEELLELALRVVDSMIEKAPGMTAPMKKQMLQRRSVGIGITGLAQFLYKHGMDYDGSAESLEMVSRLAERHMFYLYKASIKMHNEQDPVMGTQHADVSDWLPIDTMINRYQPEMDWKSIRGAKRLHSVLVAHMPTESSAVFSGASNGLYPPRQKVIYKKARTGNVQFIVDNDNFLTAWQVDNITHLKYYSRVQDWTDQGISADTYVVPEDYANGKVPVSKLMKEIIAAWKLGVKSLYYQNTKDKTAATAQDAIAAANAEVEEGCEGGCKL